MKDKVIEKNILQVIRNTSVEENLKVFLVGGYVRDIILVKESNDIDLVVEGDAINFAKKVAQKLKRNPV